MSVRNLAIVLSPSLAIPAPLFALLLNQFSNQSNLISSPLPSSDSTLPIPPSVDPASTTVLPRLSLGLGMTLTDDDDYGHSIPAEVESLLPVPRSPGLPTSPRDTSSFIADL